MFLVLDLVLAASLRSVLCGPAVGAVARGDRRFGVGHRLRSYWETSLSSRLALRVLRLEYGDSPDYVSSTRVSSVIS